MTLESHRRLIQAELDGEISPEDESELQQALAEDADLREEYESTKRFENLIAGDREGLCPPDDLTARIVAGVRSRSVAEPTASVFRFDRYLQPLAVAAAILMLVAGGFWYGHQSTTAQSDLRLETMIEKRGNLIEEHREIPPSQIREVYEPFIERMRSSDPDDHQTRRRIMEELEAAILELLRQ